MPLAQRQLLKQDELPSGDAAHSLSASVGLWFWWEPLDMNTAQTVYLCFNVEYNHSSIFPVTSRLRSLGILLGIHSPLSQRQWTTQKMHWTLSEKFINQMDELFTTSGRSNPNIAPFNLIALQQVHRCMQFSSTHFSQTNEYFPTLVSPLRSKG